MSFDPAALQRLSGPRRRAPSPVQASFLLRVGAAAGVAAALTDVVLLLVARAAGWDTSVDGQFIQPLAVVLVCIGVAVLAALASYVAARVTKRPQIWVLLFGLGLWLASIQAVPPAVIAMHTVAAAWIVGFLTRAVREGTHLR